MATQLAKKKPAATSAPAKKRRRRPAAKAPVRRRRTVAKKKGLLGDMFATNDMELGFKTLVAVGIGNGGAEILGRTLNPDGTKNSLEILVKLGGGFIAATAGKMPALGAGMMASGFKRVIAVNPQVAATGLGDNRSTPMNYLNDSPKIIDTGLTMNDNGYLMDYTAGYQSRNY